MELARNLKVESVGQLGLVPPIALSSLQTVDDAIRLMRTHGAGCVLLTSEGRLTGIFTEKDLLCRVLVPRLPLSTPLSTVATQPPVFLASTEPVGMAIARMVEKRLRHLPVVDESMRPVGVLTSRNVLRFLAKHFPRTIHTLPPRLGMRKTARPPTEASGNQELPNLKLSPSLNLSENKGEP